MAASDIAAVLRQVYRTIKRVQDPGVRHMESYDADEMQIYSNPTIIQFYVGARGGDGNGALPVLGDDDRCPHIAREPVGGYVTDGRIVLPGEHARQSHEVLGHRDGSEEPARGKCTANQGEVLQMQQPPDGAAMPRAAEDTASLNQCADVMIVGMARGVKLGLRHRRRLYDALERSPPPLGQRRGVSPAGQAQYVNDDDKETSGSESQQLLELSPDSRSRHDAERYLRQTNGPRDTDDSNSDSAQSHTHGREEIVQAFSSHDNTIKALPSRADEPDAEDSVDPAPLDSPTNGTGAHSCEGDLHIERQQPANGYEHTDEPQVEDPSLGPSGGAERSRPRFRPGRPHSVHEPKIMPAGTSKRRMSTLRANARKASAAALREDMGGYAQQADSNDDRADELDGGQRTHQSNEDEVIQVHHPPTKRRKTSHGSDAAQDQVSEQMQKLLWRLTSARVIEREIFEAQISSHSENAAGIEAVRLDHQHRRAKVYRKRIERQIEKLGSKVRALGSSAL